MENRLILNYGLRSQRSWVRVPDRPPFDIKRLSRVLTPVIVNCQSIIFLSRTAIVCRQFKIHADHDDMLFMCSKLRH